jgi:hypothetical protein
MIETGEDSVLGFFCQDMTTARGRGDQPSMVDVNADPSGTPCQPFRRDVLIHFRAKCSAEGPPPKLRTKTQRGSAPDNLDVG